MDNKIDDVTEASNLLIGGFRDTIFIQQVARNSQNNHIINRCVVEGETDEVNWRSVVISQVKKIINISCQDHRSHA